MSLNGEERRKIILDLLSSSGKVNARHLSEKLEVSSETVRRDLDILEQEKKLKKVYGGAIKAFWSGAEPPFLQRAVRFENEKRRVGNKAGEYVEDNDVILIDVGTTTLQMLHSLCGKKDITVVTNSIPALTMLVDFKNSDRFSGHILFIGGEINAEQMTVSGPISEWVTDQLYVNKAFIATCGISLDCGLTSYDAREASLSRKLISKARQTFILADSSKIGVTNLYKFADLSEIDAVICDCDAPSEWKEGLRKKNVAWISAK